MFLSVCFPALSNIPLHPTQILFKWPSLEGGECQMKLKPFCPNYHILTSSIVLTLNLASLSYKRSCFNGNPKDKTGQFWQFISLFYNLFYLYTYIHIKAMKTFFKLIFLLYLFKKKKLLQVFVFLNSGQLKIFQFSITFYELDRNTYNGNVYRHQ